MDSGFATDLADGCMLTVRAHPGARKNGVTGVHADAVKIALTAPPVDGKANEALIRISRRRASIAASTHCARGRC